MQVRDSVAWLLSRIVDIHPDVALDPAQLPTVAQALMAGLQMETNVAANCCWVQEEEGGE